jgi:hypothetical protein
MARDRRHKRFSTGSMDLTSESLFELKVEIADMSVNGVCIKGTKRFQLGSKCDVRFHNMDTIDPIGGYIVWENFSERRKDFSGDVNTYYMAGIKFEKDFSGFSGKIDFSEKHSVLHDCQAYAKRFEIRNGVTALLRYKELFKVKSLSMGGLLIESLNKIQKNEKMQMKLYLPGDRRAIQFEGRVVSSVDMKVRSKMSDRYNVGIEFLDMGERDRVRLRSFVRSLSAL